MTLRPRFSIALLSEDRSETTWRGLKVILEKLLRRFEDDGFTPRVHVLPSDPSVRPVLIANRWRNTTGQYESEKRELARYIARKISEPGGFIVFHYDGDTTWSGRARSLGRSQFERELRTRVEQWLTSFKVPRDEIVRRMRRLVECVPFYCIEAWTYQATARAIAICRERHRGADVEKFEEWEADRGRLDEILKPKTASCLRDEHNEDLARHIPLGDVAQAGKSLTWFLWCLHACPDLDDALA